MHEATEDAREESEPMVADVVASRFSLRLGRFPSQRDKYFKKELVYRDPMTERLFLDYHIGLRIRGPKQRWPWIIELAGVINKERLHLRVWTVHNVDWRSSSFAPECQ